MNAEIDHFPTVSDNESEYSEYSEDEPQELHPLEPILMGLDGFNSGEQDLSEAEFYEEVCRHYRDQYKSPFDLDVAFHVSRIARVIRFWVLDYADGMANGHYLGEFLNGRFLGPFHEWDINDKIYAYMQLIVEESNEARMGTRLPEIRKMDGYGLLNKFNNALSGSKDSSPRKQVLWVIKELTSIHNK
jgi:hypothetical protein